ncbi:hypothetical protein ASC97_04045 [Rhizobium sp. Root1203]|nr:hypothetical protein ASC97_04045 [Rhizobium sp. Root1203]
MNPAIFSPAWIRRYIDLTIDDGSEAEVHVIHSEIADFMLSDLRFTVERNRITLRSMVHDMELLVAIFQQMFGEVLGHTPIWAYGVNLERHVDFGSFEKRNELGRRLCPLEPWGDWAKDFENKNPKMNGGMSTVSMKKQLSLEPEAYEIFTIQPSNAKEMDQSGVFFGMNNHFSQVTGKDKTDESFRKHLLQVMRENVPSYVSNFEGIVDHFMAWGEIHD